MNNQTVIIFVIMCCLCLSICLILLYYSSIIVPTQSPSPSYQTLTPIPQSLISLLNAPVIIAISTVEPVVLSPLPSWIGKVVICNNNCDLTISLPSNGSIVANSSIVFLRYGTGNVAIYAGSAALTLGTGQFGMALAKSNKTWVIYGNPHQLGTINSPNLLVTSSSIKMTSSVVDALVICSNTTNDILITLPGDDNIITTTLVPIGSSILFWRSNTGGVQFISDGISTIQNVLQSPDPTGTYIGMGLFAVATRTSSNLWNIVGSLSQVPSQDTTYLSLRTASSPPPPPLSPLSSLTPLSIPTVTTILVTSIMLLPFMVGTWIQCDNPADIVITLPADSNQALSSAIPVGTQILFLRFNSGNVSFASDGKSFVISSHGSFINKNSDVSVTKGAGDTWILYGSLSVSPT